MKTNVSIYQDKREFRVFVTETYPNLIQLKREGDRSSFNALVLKIMPEIRKYVNDQLNTAIKKGHFSKNKFKADDIIDQLFIEIYDNIEEVAGEKKFYLWLFKKTNQLLDDIIVEEEFDDIFFENIDDYSKPEWDEMEEKYSTDGGGDLLLIDVFVENDEKAMCEKIDANLSKEQVERHIAMVLLNLPFALRNVFELYTKQHLDLQEIAEIRNNTVEEVTQLLTDAKKALQVSFFNRYPVDKK